MIIYCVSTFLLSLKSSINMQESASLSHPLPSQRLRYNVQELHEHVWYDQVQTHRRVILENFPTCLLQLFLHVSWIGRIGQLLYGTDPYQNFTTVYKLMPNFLMVSCNYSRHNRGQYLVARIVLVA